MSRKASRREARVGTVKRLVDLGHGSQLQRSGDLARLPYWPAYAGGPGRVCLPDESMGTRSHGLGLDVDEAAVRRFNSAGGR